MADNTTLSLNAGWMGTMGQVLHTLRMYQADTDEQGRPCVRGTVSSFMGLSGENTDVVVGADAQYRVHQRDAVHTASAEQDCPNCQWTGLAAALNSTSYGLRNVTVIA